MSAKRSETPKKGKRKRIIDTIVVLMILGVGAFVMMGCSNQEGAVEPVPTEAAKAATATVVPDDEPTEKPQEPTATAT